jgi:hypothetical protein
MHMPDVTIISREVRTVDGTVTDGHVLVDPSQLQSALGWELKSEGLCREDVCIPVRDQATLFVGDRVDIVRIAEALGRPVVVDDDSRLVSIALPSEERRQALDGLVAPSFELADLDGTTHRLDEWHGKKRLLVAFASW